MATPQYNFTVTQLDLEFILKQIKIAEASTTPDGSIAGLAELVGSPLLPFGLRTVDGSWNSLLPGQELLGAADNIMPRLTPANFQDAEAGTSYDSAGTVIDSQPRIISNLIVDQTASNPAAVIAAEDVAAALGNPVVSSPNGSLFIPNLSPDIGLSPAFNGWMTFFGQFFDHGLDLVTKGGNGIVFVPLQPDDPLYVEGSPTNFMVLTRATQVAGPGVDGILGTADDTTHESINTTTPFIDQNQTYTSHPSHQVFLREYVMVDGKPVSTGHLLDGAHGTGNWGEVKAQASSLLGIRLTDMDVHDVPLLATDRYGEFIRGENGFVQIVTATGLVEGDPSANGGLGIDIPADAFHTGHAFLNDIAHGAAPAAGLVADSDDTVGSLPNPDYDPTLPVGPNNSPVLPQAAGTYDNELLDRHFITGDGRGNENIGLTTVHTIFHSEHNRLVEDYKNTILESGDLTFINEWLLTDLPDLASVPTTAEGIAALNWDGERLFQAGRFVTEMQYQHLVFEEFARAVQPAIDPFVFSNSADIDPAIFAEFAHVVYRFGHSMLTETVSRIDIDMQANDVGLIQAFLNPLEFDQDGALSLDAAVGSIVRGMTRQVGNEIDEFVTEALRNNLVGLPLDLATLNMARARETGMATFNEARAQFFAMTGDSQLKPYSSWADFAPHLKNPASIINFIAAYGTHDSITAETTLAGKRIAATLLVMGDFDLDGSGVIDPNEIAPADRVDFLNHTGSWANSETGLNTVDFWIGGLAEAKNEFGGMLGSTFNFVFEMQMQNLQNGDRFYYLSRTQGTNMLNELEANTFAAMVMRNSDLGAEGSSHLPSLLFGTANYILEIDQSKQIGADPVGDNPILNALNPLVIRHAPGADVDGDGKADGGYLKYSGADHVVLGGTAGNDTLLGGKGIDSLWGDAGNDRLDGGDEADQVHGGDGDDIITDTGTPVGGADFLHGDEGNDVISSGMGNDLSFGGGGNDFIIVGADPQEVFAGRGDDFVLGGSGQDALLGNEGNDWIEGGEGFDSLSGENSELFFNSPIIGHDVLNGQGNDTDYDGESGDDIMVQGPGIQRNNGMLGFDWAIHKGDSVGANSDLGIPIFTTQPELILRDRFDSVEGLSGWRFNDVLIGTNVPVGAAGVVDGGGGVIGGGPLDSALLQKNVSLINGLQELLGVPADADPNAVAFDPSAGADILIGGAGSDKMTGKAGNDLIDGDAWLNVRIAVAAGPNNAAFTVDSMNEIRDRMLSGQINPGQLSIVREIVTNGAQNSDLDTAVYLGDFADYTIVENGDGSFTVTDDNPNAGGLGLAADEGIDTLRNIERLQFADQTVVINRAATGASVISDTTPTEDQLLTVTLGTIADPDGIDFTTLQFIWQAETAPDVWSDVGTGTSFQPGDAQVGQALRVMTLFSDNFGSFESLISEPTAAVVNVNDAPVGSVLISDTTPTADQLLTATQAFTDADGTAGVVFSYQWQAGSGTNFGDIAGATAATFTPTAAQVGQQLRVVVRYTDNGNTLESVFSAATVALAANPFAGTAGDDVIVGTAGNDVITGQGGNDTLSGLAGNDSLDGGADNDMLNGGAGLDTLVGGLGNDVLIGGTGNDIMAGGAGNDTYEVTEAGDQVIEVAGEGIDTVWSYLASYTLGANVESLVYGPALGNFSGTGNALNNLIRSNAGNDTLSGLGGNDTLNGGAGTDMLNGGAGNDTLNGDVGNDVLIGGTGNDNMFGGVGGDTYEVTEAGDQVTELAGEGSDTVWAYLASYTLGANVESLVYGPALGNFSGTGNALNNLIRSNAGNDTLNGGAGNDNLNGGAGNDTLVGGTGNDVLIGDLGNDTFMFAAGFGSDLIQGFDANPAGGQDVLNIAALGITAATFAANVTIADVGADTLVTVGAGSIRLVGIADATTVTQTDFGLAV